MIIGVVNHIHTLFIKRRPNSFMGLFLELKGIIKSFGGIKALNNVDLKVNTGEVHAIIGENGAGCKPTGT